jgi:2-polyprenyl-3-methyl-5-hydroxy-6-metoxy-1,4-benzoquinol methylase
MEHAMPTPERFFAVVNGFQQTEALKGAIELDLFTAIAEGNQTPQTIAARCQANERGVRILCDYLVIVGFLTKTDGQYGLAPDAAMFLDSRLPTYVGGAIEFLLAPMMREMHANVAAVVRKGGTVHGEEGTMSPDNPVWVKFARAMGPIMTLPARIMTQIAPVAPDHKVKLLDVAAGHGVFGAVFADAYPNVEVTALDWASVLEAAKETAQKFGVSDRHHLLPGSAFDVDFREDYDLVLLTNFLHHFDQETNVGLLKKVHAALKPGGRTVTLEFIPNDDRVTPRNSAGFAFTMLNSTAKGDAYTFAEYDQMFLAAGFSRNELHEVPPMVQRVVVSYK